MTRYSGVKNGGAPYRTYGCPKWHVARKAEYIEALVDGAVRKRLRDPKVLAALASENSADGSVRRLRDEANDLRAKLDQMTYDYAKGALTARQLKIATELAEAKLTRVEAELARVGSANTLAALVGSPDPAAEWMRIDDAGAKGAIINALGSVLAHSQPKGSRRPSQANAEKYAAWTRRIRESVTFEWKGSDDAAA